MAPRTRIRPPFTWLGDHAALASVVSTVIVAAFFRFFQLTTLPPGVYSTAASSGLQALALIHHGTWPMLTSDSGYASIWVFLQAIAIKILGPTELALRLWPAILGTLAVLTTWLWVRSWLGLRAAWLASFLLAVTPWAVTISRNGDETALYPLITSLTLWLATLAWRKRSIGVSLALAVVIIVDLLSGPIGWLLVAAVAVIGVSTRLRAKQLLSIDSSRIVVGVGAIAGLATLVFAIRGSFAQIKLLPGFLALPTSVGSFFSTIGQTLLMFNGAGDQSYRHNLAGEPMLNAFVGLMFVAGILVALSRFHERLYRHLLFLLVVLLLPALLSTTGAPNAAHAAATLPVVLALAAVGISYMLDLWYKTFPINSAARVTGQAAILVLLALTVFQGYAQYFEAWAGSSPVYVAYNEGAVQIGLGLKTDKFTGARYVLANTEEVPVVEYLAYGANPYIATSATGLTTLPVLTSPKQFWITTSQRDTAVKNLKLKYPGGVLVPHYSTFNQAEIYYTYEVSK